MKRLILLMVFLLAGSAFIHAQDQTAKQRRTVKEQNIKQLIDSRRFRFVARSVIPLSGPKVELTSSYDLKIDSMMVESWLPFYGRAYHVDYGDRDGGIKFKEEADQMNVRFNKKKKMYQIDLTVDADKDNYQISISAGLGGYADVNIVSNNRQSIGYYGTIEPLEKDQ